MLGLGFGVRKGGFSGGCEARFFRQVHNGCGNVLEDGSCTKDRVGWGLGRRSRFVI